MTTSSGVYLKPLPVDYARLALSVTIPAFAGVVIVKAGLPPGVLACARAAVVGSAMLVMVALIRSVPRVRRVDWLYLFLAGAAGAGATVLLFEAIRLGGVSVPALVVSVFPIFGIVLEPVLGKPTHVSYFMGLTLALAGVLMATPSYDAAGFTIVGLALGSALCNAIAMTANRGLVTVHHQLSPMYFFWVVEYFVAAALCVPFLLVPGAWGMVTPQAVGWVALLGLGVTAFPAIVLNTWPRPFRAAVFVLARAAEPFLAVAAAAAFLGERPPLVALAGGAVILVSVLATVGIHMVGPSRVFRPIRWN